MFPHRLYWELIISITLCLYLNPLGTSVITTQV